MVLLILFALLALAVLYGIFFLIFKLIWLLFKKQRNLWPLILAGVATVLLLVATVLLTVSAFNRFVQPFSPIIDAVSAQQPLYGERTYTAPNGAFSLTLYDGLVPSDWIRLNNLDILVGIDTNALISSDEQQQLDGFVVIKQAKDSDRTPAQLLDELAATILQSEAGDNVDLDPVLPFNAGGNSSAAIMNGTIYSDADEKNFPLVILAAQEGNDVYFLIGAGKYQRGGIDAVQSFRFDTVDTFAMPLPTQTM